MESTLGKRKEREEDSANITHGATIFVSNLPYTTTSVDLQTLFSDIAPVKSAFVVTEQGTGLSKGVGYVTFSLKEDAESAFENLSKNGISLVGRKLRVQWANSKPKDKGEKRESKPRPPPRSQPRLTVKPIKNSSTNDPAPSEVNGKASEAVPSRASRLIIRNMPFNASEQDLRAAFLPYGPIYSIQIPTDDKTTKKDDDVPTTATANKKVRTKGFAFVWMSSKKDAEKAIEGCNGMTLRAGTAEPTDDKKSATVRVIAVDWALSKEKWEAEKAKIEEDAVMHELSESDDDDDAEDDDNSNSGEENNDDDDEGHLGLHSEEREDNSNAGSEEEEENDEERVKPQLPQPEAGTTLFIRNIPFNATEDELRTLFRTFGPLRYARITLDPATGRSRGTGFACFWNLEDADKAVQQSDILRAETTGHSTVPKKNPFLLPSILTPDPSSSFAQSLVLHGRTLDVVTAVTRDVAGKLKEDNERLREKADKRNLYLLREGVIMPNTPSAELLTSADVERRTSSFNARRALLKSNPSLFISKTRLSVRQIPKFVTERMLKRLASHAVKAFESEVKQDLRQPLTTDELARVVGPEESGMVVVGDGDAVEMTDKRKEDKKKSSGKFSKGRDTGVKQSKIVRQAERVDSLTGKGRSKGYGFIEMHKHADALRLLRWANNNPDIGPLFDLWWKDELENLLKLEKAKPESEKDGDGDARVKRIKEEIDKWSGTTGGDGKKKKTKGTSLIVEFSIENIQVTKRRNASQKDQQAAIHADSKTSERKRLKDDDDDVVNIKKSDGPPVKKRRTLDKQTAKAAKSEPAAGEADHPKVNPVNPLGALIGRKRAERKSGKKKGGR